MSDKVLEKIDEIIDIVKNSDQYKTYLEIVDKLRNNKEVMTLIKDIKLLQQEAVKKQSLGTSYKEIDSEIADKLKRLEDYPIYLEYTYLRDDLDQTFQNVKITLQDYINDKTS